MNFKKVLGLVLAAAIVSTSVVAAKPAMAAKAAVTPVVATAPTSSSLKDFSYFFEEKSLVADGEQDSYVVSTSYTGKVQYELWVKPLSGNGKWQVISRGADGKPGYTEAQDGQNSLYTIPVVDGFAFKQGNYLTAVYAKVAGSNGVKSYGVKIGADGVTTTDGSGVEQRCDIARSAQLTVVSQAQKSKYADMSGELLYAPNDITVGQEVTFRGFASQKDNAKYKYIVRKYGTDGSNMDNYKFLNATFDQSAKWTPQEAGQYEVIVWSQPNNAGKNAARDGWRITTVTVKDKPVVPALTYVAGSLQAVNPIFGTADLKVNDSSLVAKVLVDGADAKFTVPDATTVRIKGLSDDPKSVTLVDKNGNNVVVKEAVKTTLTYVEGSLGTVNPIFGTVDLKVNDSSLVAKVIADGADAKFTTPDATTVRVKGLSDDPKTLVLVDKDGNQVTVKAAAPVQTSKLKYVDGSLEAVNPIFGTTNLKVNDSSLVTKVIVDGADAKFTTPDATTVRIKGLSDDPKTLVLVDNAGIQVTIK